MGNAYGITLDDASLRWAAAEGVPESVIAAICLLDQRSVDEIVAKLSPVELEQVIKIVGRSPRGYPPGAYDALRGKRNLAQPQPPIERPALKPGQPAARTNPGTEHSRRIRARRFNVPRLEVPQTSAVPPTSDEHSRRIRARRFNVPRLEVPQTSAVPPTSAERAATTVCSALSPKQSCRWSVLKRDTCRPC